jgi:hypothetical protein
MGKRTRAGRVRLRGSQTWRSSGRQNLRRRPVTEELC